MDVLYVQGNSWLMGLSVMHTTRLVGSIHGRASRVQCMSNIGASCFQCLSCFIVRRLSPAAACGCPSRSLQHTITHYNPSHSRTQLYTLHSSFYVQPTSDKLPSSTGVPQFDSDLPPPPSNSCTSNLSFIMAAVAGSSTSGTQGQRCVLFSVVNTADPE